MITIASTAACHSVRRMPSAGRPKKMKNSWTMKGVLRISSTYRPNSMSKGRTRQARTPAPSTPMATPSKVPTTVSCRVNQAPLSNRGAWASTGAKSNS
ncbi:hypothetical protein D3C79_1032390 [compost metagenome]